MDDSVLLLALLDFGLIIILPRIFFRRDGSLNARWWSTSIPLGVCPLFLVAARVFHFAPIVPHRWLTATSLVSVACLAASIALIALTLGTHRIPIALWHQANDAPRQIVTWGAYRWIRHPFYCAYLLAFLGAVACFPHWVTIAALLYMAVMLNAVAAQEERRLIGSSLGAEYREYMTGTGRFMPTGFGRSAPPVNPSPSASPGVRS